MGTLEINKMKTDAKSSGAGLDYEFAVGRMSEIEEDIGLSLAKNSQLTGLAAKIQECSEIDDYGKSDGTIKTKVNEGIDKIGGARSFKEGWGTLGGSVNAVMNQIESTQDSKLEYSISHTTNHPYFPKGVKKPEFDAKILEDEKDDPKYAKSNPNANRTARKLFDQVSQEFGNQMSLMFALANFQINDSSKEQREAAIQKTIGLKRSNGSMSGMLDALLDITLDKHSSGDNANYVKLDNPDQKNDDGMTNKDRWIRDTVSAAKPIISGPSGHTLRYLNFWAEKRDNRVKQASSSQTTSAISKEWPSLQAARLVMMADLMPPKHHSYDEIMTSSIGITDGASAPLKYESKSSYMDLVMQTEEDAHDIALQAYKDSKAYEIKANKDLDAGFVIRNAGGNESAETAETKTIWEKDDSSRRIRAKAVDARNELGSKIVVSPAVYNAPIERAINALKQLKEFQELPNADAIIESIKAAIKKVQS